MTDPKALAEKILDFVDDYQNLDNGWCKALVDGVESLLAEALEKVSCTKCNGKRRPCVVQTSMLCSYCYDEWLAQAEAYDRAAEVKKTKCWKCEHPESEVVHMRKPDAAVEAKIKDIERTHPNCILDFHLRELVKLAREGK